MDDAYVTLQVSRESGPVEYRVPFQDGMSVLSALRVIYEEIDRNLAYPMCLCRVGRCGACAVRVNGKPALGCAVPLEAGGFYALEPVREERIIRDLVSR